MSNYGRLDELVIIPTSAARPVESFPRINSIGRRGQGRRGGSVAAVKKGKKRLASQHRSAVAARRTQPSKASRERRRSMWWTQHGGRACCFHHFGEIYCFWWTHGRPRGFSRPSFSIFSHSLLACMYQYVTSRHVPSDVTSCNT